MFDEVTDLRPTSPRRRMRPWRLVALVLPTCLLTWLLCGWLAVELAMAPTRRPIESLPSLGGKPVENVATTTADGVDVRGWWVQASDRRAVLVFAGYGGNRTSNLGLAEFYLSKGWTVLLPDLRATGSSGGDRVGFGYPERHDVKAWVDFARARGIERIALHGQSLGAAAVVYSFATEKGDYAFVVLDSCYDDLRNALHNRLRWVPLASWLLQPVEWFGAAALGAPVDALRPVDHVGSMSCPVLFVAGDQDPKVTPAETRALFAACGSVRKEICWMPGGRHENLWSRFAAMYGEALEGLVK